DVVAVDGNAIVGGLHDHIEIGIAVPDTGGDAGLDLGGLSGIDRIDSRGIERGDVEGADVGDVDGGAADEVEHELLRGGHGGIAADDLKVGRVLTALRREI